MNALEKLFAELPGRVEAGAKLLDERQQGWFYMVTYSMLNLGDEIDCPLGQLYGDYESGQEALGLSHEDCLALGLTVSHSEIKDAYQAVCPDENVSEPAHHAARFRVLDAMFKRLTDLWIAAIINRRSEGMPLDGNIVLSNN